MEKQCQILIKKHKNDVSVLLTQGKKMLGGMGKKLKSCTSPLSDVSRKTNKYYLQTKKKTTEKETKQQLTR